MRDLGLHPTSEEARRAVTLVRDNLTLDDGGQPSFSGETETWSLEVVTESRASNDRMDATSSVPPQMSGDPVADIMLVVLGLP